MLWGMSDVVGLWEGDVCVRACARVLSRPLVCVHDAGARAHGPLATHKVQARARAWGGPRTPNARARARARLQLPCMTLDRTNSLVLLVRSPPRATHRQCEASVAFPCLCPLPSGGVRGGAWDAAFARVDA